MLKTPFTQMALALVTLSAFSISQPLFSVLTQEPSFFLIRGNQPWDILAFVAISVLGIPAAFSLILWILGKLLGARIQALASFLVITALSGAFALLTAKEFYPQASNSIAYASIALGAGLALACLRAQPVLSTLAWLSPAAVYFVSAFLSSSGPATAFSVGSRLGEVSAHFSKDPANRVPVVLVVFDEFPLTSLLNESGEIDERKFPNFYALKNGATWYKRAGAVAETTHFAVPALLTGRFPHSKNAKPAFVEYPVNLFSILEKGGYELRTFESTTSLLPPSETDIRHTWMRTQLLLEDLSWLYVKVLLPDELSRWAPDTTHNWMNFSPRRKLSSLSRDAATSHSWNRDSAEWFREEFRQHGADRRYQKSLFLDSLSSSASPSLYFLHILLPHVPYRLLPSGRAYDNLPNWRDDEGIVGGDWPRNDPYRIARSYRRHLLQVGYVDRLIGEIVSKLKQEKLYDSSLLIITADHGVSFRPGSDRREIDAANFGEIASIPLFVKYPHQKEGRVDENLVQSTDILPTILDVLKVEAPSLRLDGTSLAAIPFPKRDAIRLFDNGIERKYENVSERIPEILALRRSLIGKVRDWSDIYRFGPNSDLIGEDLEKFEIADAPALHLRTLRPLEAPLPANAMEFPFRIRGLIKSAELESERLNLAVAVDGKIRAVSQTSPRNRDRWEFWAQLPEEAFAPKQKKRIEVFAVERFNDRVRLLPLKWVGAISG